MHLRSLRDFRLHELARNLALSSNEADLASRLDSRELRVPRGEMGVLLGALGYKLLILGCKHGLGRRNRHTVLYNYLRLDNLGLNLIRGQLCLD